MKTLVSIFSGGGGLDLGLEAAGFKTIFATDIDEHSCTSLEANKITSKKLNKPFLRNAKIHCEDIKNLSGKDILKFTGLKKGELDLLAGGPPCQAFSVFGRRKGKDDPRSDLVNHYLRLLKEIRPKAFVFENVYGLLTIHNGKLFEEIKTKLEKPQRGLKYKLSVHRLNAVDYGVPQFRDRVFIIGSIDDHDISDIKPFFADKKNLTYGLLPWRTVKNGLRGIAPAKTKGWHNHIGRKHSERIIERYSNMSFGERDHFTRINRLDPNRPSYTIIVGSDAGGGKGHIHPFEGREVTPRESARMQCFPDWWWFSGTSRHPIRQVGNAVPTLLGMFIGREILKTVFDEVPVSVFDAISLLDQKHLFTKKEIEYLKDFDSLDQQIDLPVAI